MHMKCYLFLILIFEQFESHITSLDYLSLLLMNRENMETVSSRDEYIMMAKQHHIVEFHP